MRRLVWLILLLAAMLQPIAAWAHASLVRAEPADGTTVSEPPTLLRLIFNEPVSPLLMRLIGPTGQTTTPDAKAENSTITITPGELQQGTHVLSWRVVSADGHPMGGSVVFSVGAPSDTSNLANVETPSTVKAAIWIARLILYIGLFIGVGGAVFASLIAESRSLPGRVETWLSGIMILALVVCPISLGLQGLDGLALPLGDFWRPQVWRLALALTISGHASTAEPQWLSRASVFLHVLCVAFWIGSLLPLLALLYGPREGERALARFSRIIPAALVALAATGIFLIYVQFDRFDAF